MKEKSNKKVLIISTITMVFVVGLSLVFMSMYFSMHNIHNLNKDMMDSNSQFMNHDNMGSNIAHNNMDHNQMLANNNLMNSNNLNKKVPTEPGQDAFGTIEEIVNMLNNDKNTNWEKVNITALKEHLVDMDLLITKTNIIETKTTEGLIMQITAKDQRSIEAIKRMVPAHSDMVLSQNWNSKTTLINNGVILEVSDKTDFIKIQHLGFYGLMSWGGNHHQVHHLALAKGEVIFN